MNRIALPFIAVLVLVSTASAEWKEKVLYSFQGGTDGAFPIGAVVFDKVGNLYGATGDGGASNCDSPGQCGAVYQLSPPATKGGAWTETVLYIFKGHAQSDGATPEGGLVIDQAGNLYGTTGYGGSGPCTLLGGAVGCGTVYELSPPAKQGDPWRETVLYSFRGGKDGYVASGDLVFDKAGNLYGVTLFGGGKGTTCDVFYGGQCGTVFKLTPSKQKGGKWTEKVLHGFAGGGTDGASPNGGLLPDGKGAIYGTTLMGGNQLCNFGNGNIGCGIAFKLLPPVSRRGIWGEKILHRFTNRNDGANPSSGLVVDAKGSLYGTTGGGGSGNGFGVVFRLTQSQDGKWNETSLYSFQGGSDGRGPGDSPLLLDSLGDLYGTAYGGQSFRGVVFQLKPAEQGNSWRFSVLYNFTGSPDGAYPRGRLVFREDNLYSTTQGGGTGQACQGGCGAVFELRP
jgi:uncharacterized repeat protein (TIGR03803 family)